MTTGTAVRAVECGHVLAFAEDDRLIKRLTETFTLLIETGDTRFELVEIDDLDASTALLDGLSCLRCAITPAQLRLAAVLQSQKGAE